MNTDVMFSKKSDNWTTPPEIYTDFMEKGYFDPCPTNPRWNGLEISWNKKNYVNPPYSQIRKWLEKAIQELKENGNISIFLIPARTDTKWFHELVYKKYKITFIKGRLKFGDGKQSAPFPSMWVYIE